MVVSRPGDRTSWRAEILIVLSRRDDKSLRGSLAKACHKPRLLALVLTTNPLHRLLQLSILQRLCGLFDHGERNQAVIY